MSDYVCQVGPYIHKRINFSAKALNTGLRNYLSQNTKNLQIRILLPTERADYMVDDIKPDTCVWVGWWRGRWIGDVTI